jgi:hypothetical protein
MHLPTLFYTLATLAITAAVPVTAENSTATPTATQAIDAPSQANPVATPSMTPVGAYRCPPKQFKRCCLTLQQTSRELIDGLGELVPVLGGLSVSSLISFDCMSASGGFSAHIISSLWYYWEYDLQTANVMLLGKAMADDISPNDCDVGGYAPMCCNSADAVCSIPLSASMISKF